MGAWCFHYGHGWGTPCNLDVVLAVVFAFIAILTVAAQTKRYRTISSLSTGTQQGTWSNMICIVAYTAVALSPFVWLIASLIIHRGLVAGFQIFAETVFLASWAPIVVRPWLVCSPQLHISVIQMGMHASLKLGIGANLANLTPPTASGLALARTFLAPFLTRTYWDCLDPCSFNLLSNRLLS